MQKLELVKLEDWKDLRGFVESLPKEKSGYKIVTAGEAVQKCTSCDPEVFPLLKQFYLDGGTVEVDAKSLELFGIKASRLPEFFTVK